MFGSILLMFFFVIFIIHLKHVQKCFGVVTAHLALECMFNDLLSTFIRLTTALFPIVICKSVEIGANKE